MRSKLICCAWLAALCSIPAWYRDACAVDAERSHLYALGEVVVSGPDEGVQASETLHVVTDEEIRARGARTLEQAIALLPGVNVRNGADGVPRIDIRGFRTRHVLLLLDGIPMNSALDQQFDPTAIPTENIAEIKLTSGASSVLYGQGGLGGVINIVTKKGSPGVHGGLAGEAGDHGHYLTRGSVSGATDRYNYFLSGSAAGSDGFPLAGDFTPTSEQGGGYRKNSDRERNNLLATLGFTPNKDLNLGLTVNWARGAFGKPASALNDPFDPFASPPKYVRVTDFSGVSVQLAADYAASERLSFRGWTFVNRHGERDNQYDDGNLNSFLASGAFQQRVETYITGATLQPKYDFGAAGAVTMSLASEWDGWDNDGSTTLSPGVVGPLSLHKSLAVYSLGMEYEVKPLPGLALVAGYGRYWQAREAGNDDDYSLLAGATYDLFQETRLKASFKRNIRFPSLGDLYDPAQGNAQLATETSYTSEAGVEQQLPKASTVGLTGFYTTARNLIQTDQASGRSMNLADVRFAGVEVAAATQWVQHLLVRATYAYLHSEDRSRAGRDQQQYTPGDKATLEAKYDFASGFTPYLSLMYVGNQYFYTKNNVTPVEKAKLNDYTVVNVKLSQSLLHDKVTLYVGADNLFDENYETSYGFPQAGRFLYGGVEFRM